MSHAQTDSIITDEHIFWSNIYRPQPSDFQADTVSEEYYNKCDEYNLCWGAAIGIFSILDEPKKRRKRGKLLEKVYFAPAFCKSQSYALNNDSLGYASQLLVFDLYELTARKNRKDLQAVYEMIPAYGTKYIRFKTIEARNNDVLKQLIGQFVHEVYIEKTDGAYEKWRKLIDDLLTETSEYATTSEDRLRFIKNAPLDEDYQMAETVIGASGAY
jgi:hypothetical protein